MFTGIIEAIGTVAAMEPKGGDMRLRISSGALDLEDVRLGDSIAVNGVCLTVTALPGNGFWADVSGETLRRTGYAQLKVGDRVNLEKALTPSTRLGGHLVSGHVDGVGEVIERSSDGRSIHFRIKVPDELARYIAEKGSITVDGISLTVNGVDGAVFELNIVPHTLEQTTMAAFKSGTHVNLEVDIIARYLERLVMGDKAAELNSSGVTKALLEEHGFV